MMVIPATMSCRSTLPPLSSPACRMKDKDHGTTVVFIEDLAERSPEPNSMPLYFMQSFQESGAIGDAQLKKLLGAGSMAISNGHPCAKRILFAFTNL